MLDPTMYDLGRGSTEESALIFIQLLTGCCLCTAYFLLALEGVSERMRRLTAAQSSLPAFSCRRMQGSTKIGSDCDSLGEETSGTMWGYLQ